MNNWKNLHLISYTRNPLFYGHCCWICIILDHLAKQSLAQSHSYHTAEVYSPYAFSLASCWVQRKDRVTKAEVWGNFCWVAVETGVSALVWLTEQPCWQVDSWTRGGDTWWGRKRSGGWQYLQNLIWHRTCQSKIAFPSKTLSLSTHGVVLCGGSVICIMWLQCFNQEWDKLRLGCLLKGPGTGGTLFPHSHFWVTLDVVR